jgi:hypothetical protein
MSNWTPKQALSELMLKFRRTGSDESSSYSSGSDNQAMREEGDDEQVSALALMNEKSPESWLGNFLTIIGAPTDFSFTSLKLAQGDKRLREYLSSVADDAASEDPERFLEPGFAEELRESAWNAWWRGQDALTRYAYATLSLAMLGDTERMPSTVSLYRQETNARLKKDAHYVLCYLLGKDWPAYAVTETDLRRVASGDVSPASEA